MMKTAPIGICLALSCLAACGPSNRERVGDQVEAVRVRLYRASWGGAPSEERLAADRVAFGCVWDAVTDAGGDPNAEFQCFIRQTESYTACLGHVPSAASGHDVAGSIDSCRRESEALCVLSDAFQTAGRDTCASPTSPRPPVQPPRHTP